nr:hypothetical protein [Luteibacter rhizovicinus]
MAEYYIVSIKHTHRRDLYITVWRPNDSGYAYPLSWAGLYAEDLMLAKLGYYNSGCSAVAVPCEVFDRIAVPPSPGMIDNDAGPVVFNNAKSWRAIRAGVIMPPAHPIVPEFTGARRLTTEKAVQS